MSPATVASAAGLETPESKGIQKFPREREERGERDMADIEGES